MLYHIISYYITLYSIRRVLEQNWASSKEVGRCQVPVLLKGPDIVFVYVWESTFFVNLGPPITAAGNLVICYTSLRNDCITTVCLLLKMPNIFIFFSTELVAYLHLSKEGRGHILKFIVARPLQHTRWERKQQESGHWPLHWISATVALHLSPSAPDLRLI